MVLASKRRTALAQPEMQSTSPAQAETILPRPIGAMHRYGVWSAAWRIVPGCDPRLVTTIIDLGTSGLEADELPQLYQLGTVPAAPLLS